MSVNAAIAGVVAVIIVINASGSLAQSLVPNEPITNCSLPKNKPATTGSETAFSCYSCFDFDYKNCARTQTCCNTACFKLVDDVHSVIAKGCWSKDLDSIKSIPTDGHARSYTLDSLMPGTNENLTGIAHYCTHEFCNSANPMCSFSMLIGSCFLLLAVIGAMYK